MNQEEINELVDDIRDGMIGAWDRFGWVQGYVGDDQQGYCMVGAWERATGQDSELYQVFSKCATDVIRDAFPGRPMTVIGFNDSDRTSEEDVKFLAKHAFERMKEVLPELIEDLPGA